MKKILIISSILLLLFMSGCLEKPIKNPEIPQYTEMIRPSYEATKPLTVPLPSKPVAKERAEVPPPVPKLEEVEEEIDLEVCRKLVDLWKQKGEAKTCAERTYDKRLDVNEDRKVDNRDYKAIMAHNDDLEWCTKKWNTPWNPCKTDYFTQSTCREGQLRGDLNDDGEITYRDTATFTMYWSRILFPEYADYFNDIPFPENFSCMDLDGDGTIYKSDAGMIYLLQDGTLKPTKATGQLSLYEVCKNMIPQLEAEGLVTQAAKLKAVVAQMEAQMAQQ